MFTVTNAVLVAMAQVAVIVGGVLGAGLTQRLLRASLPGTAFAESVGFLVNRGVWLLALPLIWITAVAVIRRRETASDEAKSLAFSSGLAVIAALLLLFGYVLVQAWFNLGGGLWQTAPADVEEI